VAPSTFPGEWALLGRPACRRVRGTDRGHRYPGSPTFQDHQIIQRSAARVLASAPLACFEYSKVVGSAITASLSASRRCTSSHLRAKFLLKLGLYQLILLQLTYRMVHKPVGTNKERRQLDQQEPCEIVRAMFNPSGGSFLHLIKMWNKHNMKRILPNFMVFGARTITEQKTGTPPAADLFVWAFPLYWAGFSVFPVLVMGRPKTRGRRLRA